MILIYIEKKGNQIIVDCKENLNEAESKKAQEMLGALGKEILQTKTQGAVTSVLEVLHKKSKKSQCLSEKLLSQGERIIKGGTSLCQTKPVYDILPPNIGTKKIPSSLFGESSSALKTFTIHYPNAKNFVAISKSGLIAVVEKDHLNFYSSDLMMADSLKESLSSDKLKIPPLSKVHIGFMICSAKFNEENDSYIAVSGITECVVVTVESNTGKVISKLPIELNLQAMGDNFTISKVMWLPYSQTHLAIAAQMFVKVFNLSGDSICPLYTFFSTESNVIDVAIIKEDMQSTNYFFKILADNIIFNATLDIQLLEKEKQHDVNFPLIEPFGIPEPLVVLIHQTNIVSLYYSTSAHLLFLTLGNGKIVYGELDSNKSSLTRFVVSTLGEDLTSQKFLFSLQEIDVEPDALWLTALSQGSHTLGAVVRIDEKEFIIQHLKMKSEGLQIHQGKSKSGKRIATLGEDSSLSIFALHLGEPSSKKSPFLAIVPEPFKLLDKSKLPKKVVMPIDHFEKASNVMDSSLNLVKKVKFGGSISLLVGKDYTALVEWLLLSRGGNQVPVGNPPVTIDIQLESPDYVFAGIRIIARTAPRQYLTIFNRRIHLNPPVSLHTDVGFCDAEIMSVENNTLHLSLEAEDAQIKLSGIDIFLFHKDNFGYQDKLAKLEQSLLQKAASKVAELTRFSSIINTKSYHISPWIGKEDILATAIPDSPILRTLVTVLEYYSSIAITSKSEALGNELLEMLSDYIYVGIEDGITLQVLRSSVRKCAKAIIYSLTKSAQKIEDDRNEYDCFKILALQKSWQKTIVNQQNTDTIEKYVKAISKFAKKNRMCFFDLLSKNSEIITQISAVLLPFLEHILENTPDNKQHAKEALENYWHIIFAYHDYLLNISWQHKDPSKRTPHGIIEPIHISQISKLILPYFLSKSEEIKDILISILPDMLNKRNFEYLQTCQTPVKIKYKQWSLVQDAKRVAEEMPEEIELRSFDFCYVLGLILTEAMQNQLTNDSKKLGLFYAIFYHLISSFQKNIINFKTIESSSDENWGRVFCKFIETALIKRNVGDKNENRDILLALKLFNQLFIFRGKKAKEDKQMPKSLELEFSCKLLASLSLNDYFFDWISNSFATAFASLKFKFGENSKEKMQDIPEKQLLLKFKPKMAKDYWSVIFPGEQLLASESLDNAEFEIMKELCKTLYNYVSYEELLDDKSGKNSAKHQQLLKNIKDTICETLLTPAIASVLDNSVKKVFHILSHTKNELHLYQDNFIYNISFKAIKETIINNDNSFEQQLILFKHLIGIWKIASERPSFWKQYIKENTDILPVLFQVSNSIHEKIAFQAISLISLALENGENEKYTIKHSYETIQKYAGRTIEIIDMFRENPLVHSGTLLELIPYNDSIFTKGMDIVNQFVLDSNSLQIRVGCAHLLHGLWDSGTPEQRNKILQLVVSKFNNDFYKYGCATLQLLYLCLYLFQAEPEKIAPSVEAILKALIENALKGVKIMQTHENGEIYREVQAMLKTSSKTSNEKASYIPRSEDGKEFIYCLSQVPCGICVSDIGKSYTIQKIGDIKEDVKFSDDSYIYKLSNSYSIQKIMLDIDMKGQKYVKYFNVYVSNSRETDLSELRNNMSVWQKVGTLSLKPDSNLNVLEFPIPVTTSLIFFEFVLGVSSEPSGMRGFTYV